MKYYTLLMLALLACCLYLFHEGHPYAASACLAGVLLSSFSNKDEE